MRDEPLPPGLFEEALDLLHRALLAGVVPAPGVLEGFAAVLPALRAQDWRQHRAEAVQR